MTKLIETVANGAGVLYEPRRVRRLAKAEAEAAAIRAEGEMRAALLRKQGEIEIEGLVQRAAHRIAAREVRRQANLENIVEAAETHLPDEVSERPVDEDWTAEFVRLAEDVSDQDLQSLWGRLLASEIEKPGTIGYRTLHLVKCLHPSEAVLFSKACVAVWHFGEILAIPAPGNRSGPLPVGLSRTSLRLLEELGLLGDADDHLILETTPMQARYGNMYFALSAHEPTSPSRVWLRTLTSVGQQLYPLSGASPDASYRSEVIAAWRSQGIDAIEYAP